MSLFEIIDRVSWVNGEVRGVLVGLGLIMGLDGFMRGYGVAFSLFEIIDRVGTQMLG